MARYFFDLCDGAGGIEDTSGTELLHDRAAVAHGYRVAREMMRHNEPQSRKLCIAVHDDRRRLLFRLPFAAVDETIDCRFPETRALVERSLQKQLTLAEAVHEARKTVRQSRALVARSRGMPYLCAENGEAFV